MGLRMASGAGLALMLVAGLAVSSCSSSPPGSQTAAQLMPEVQAASETAASVHIAGSVRKGAQTTTIDVRISGDSVAGTLGAYGTSYFVLSLNGTSFVKLNAAFLKIENAPAGLCARVCGKYVQLPAASASRITAVLSMQQLVSDVFNDQNMSSAAASSCIFSPATQAGQSVLQCRQGGYTLDVAAHGKPYLVFWGGPHGQHLRFSDWNSVALPAAPPASQVVSIGELG